MNHQQIVEKRQTQQNVSQHAQATLLALISLLLLKLVINLFSGCFARVKCDSLFSDYFRVMLYVRQDSVLSPLLFVLYVDDIHVCSSVTLFQGCHIISASLSERSAYATGVSRGPSVCPHM